VEIAWRMRKFFSRASKKLLTIIHNLLKRHPIKHVMHPSNQDRTFIFPTRYSAEKGGIVDGN